MKKTTLFLLLVLMLALLGFICWLRYAKPLDHPATATQTMSPSPAPPTPEMTPTPTHRRWDSTPPPETPAPTPIYESLTEEQFVQQYGGDSEQVDEYVVEVGENEVFTIN